MSGNEILTIKLPPGETERPAPTPTVPAPEKQGETPQTPTPTPNQPARPDADPGGSIR